jgi:cytidine deaminase
LFPSEKITAIAISYRNDNTETPAENILSPCGICRQSLLETTGRQQRDITVILSSPAGQVIKLESAGDLLPLAFSAKDL